MRRTQPIYVMPSQQQQGLEIDVDAPGADQLRLAVRQQGGGNSASGYVIDGDRYRAAMMRRAVIGMVTSTVAAGFIAFSIPHAMPIISGLCFWMAGLLIFKAAHHARDHYRLRDGSLPLLAWVASPRDWLPPALTGGLVDAFLYLRQRLFPAPAHALRITHEPGVTLDFGSK